MSKVPILIIAPGVTSNDVGEVYLAYKWMSELSQHFAVTLLTVDRKGKNTISDGELDIDIVRFRDYGSLPYSERFNSMLKPWYPVFYFQARSWIKRNRERFAWVHQLNPFGMRYPCPAHGLGLKFSIGPVAGGLADIDAFQSELVSVPWYIKLRSLDSVRAKYDPFIKRTYNEASVILAAAPYVKEIIAHRFPDSKSEIIIMNEHGVDGVSKSRVNFATNELRLLYVGRVVRTKGVRDLIRALQYVHLESFHLDVIGAGDDLEKCREEAVALGVNDKVTFHGHMHRKKIDEYYSFSDVMVFPSFREPSGGVVVEAMASGLPQIVADYGGPASMVKEDFGRLIQPISPASYPKIIADAINGMSDSNLLELMSGESVKYCDKYYKWSNKIALFKDIIIERI